VHVRGFDCRGLRLDRFAVVAMALAMPVLAAVRPQGTQTRLSVETRDLNGRTQAMLSVAVASDSGQPVSGTVVIEDEGNALAGGVLDAQGKALVKVDLLPGEHLLRAVFGGSDSHRWSASDAAGVNAQAGSSPDFTVSVSPGSLSLTAGESGSATVSVTPINAGALSAPMFVTLSCSGLPDQSLCNFTPENVEILPNATAAITSSMVIITQSAGTRGLAVPPLHSGTNPVAWAVLLPGVFGLAGLAFSARRRRWLRRLTLVALLGLVTVIGTVACAPRYNYFNHGPPNNLPTPAGTYQLLVTAQSSNGITATTHSTPFALTVK